MLLVRVTEEQASLLGELCPTGGGVDGGSDRDLVEPK